MQFLKWQLAKGLEPGIPQMSPVFWAEVHPTHSFYVCTDQCNAIPNDTDTVFSCVTMPSAQTIE